MKRYRQPSAPPSWRNALLLASFAAAMGLPASSQARQTAATPTATLEALSALGPEARALEATAGLWDVSITSWETPVASPVVLDGLVAERMMVGPMLQETLRPAPGAASTAFVRADFLTYNRLEGRWQYMSMDSRVPDGLMSAWSLDADPANRIFMSFLPFATPDAVAPDALVTTGRYLRMEQVITRQDANHETKDQYFTMAGPAPVKWLAIQYRYTRRG